MHRFKTIPAALIAIAAACSTRGDVTNPISTSATTQPIDAMRTYVCRRTPTPLVIDGRPDDAAWAMAEWTEDFVDIEGSKRPLPAHRTRVKMLWDDQFLYVYAEMIEPHLWATLTEKNSTIYHDNDFEIFLDPTGSGENYYEFEMNALGTIWELTLDKPYRRKGKPTLGTNLPSLRSAVHLEGTLNEPSDVDRGWSCEIAIPYNELAGIKVPAKLPIRVGDEWRINFSRVQWTLNVVDGKYVKVPKETKPEDNWVWSAQGVIDMHVPEKWGVLRFAD